MVLGGECNTCMYTVAIYGYHSTTLSLWYGSTTWKPGPFSSSSLGMGTRLNMECDVKGLKFVCGKLYSIHLIALLCTHTHTHTPQINFFQDHTKIIICPLMSAVSYISEDKSFRNFRLPLIERHGCSKELYSRLRYAKTMTERLIAKMDSQSSKVSTEHQPTPIPTPTPMA